MTKKVRHNYKNLKIWKLGLKISNNISDILQKFPKHKKYDLSSQLNRCSVFMPSNITEDYARTNKSFLYSLDTSLGLSFELNTQLLVENYKKYINNNTLIKLEEKIAEFQKITISFQNGLNKKS